MSEKPKVAFYWCASCGGCEETVVDLEARVLDVVAAVDIVFWPCAMDFKTKDVESMADGSIAVSFINGAIRTQEQKHMAKLLRAKSQIVIAFGACSSHGGIPALANLTSKKEIFRVSYHNSPTVENKEGVEPKTSSQVDGYEVMLPHFFESVYKLSDCVDVDYTMPGCPPTSDNLMAAVNVILSGELPPKGAVLVSGKSLCESCERNETKPDDISIGAIKRVVDVELDHQTCFLAQGVVCMGPATNDGCGVSCVDGNMPCSGCYGPTPNVKDQGGKMISMLGGVLEGDDPHGIQKNLVRLNDPAGTFLPLFAFRFSYWLGQEQGGGIMGKTITIDPITRLEGHGKISIFLDDKGDVDRAIFQVPELRGFEAFCQGRLAEDMPQITSRACGVCPTAHHMASTKALDDLYKVEPTPAAKAIRKLFYNLFMFEDHLIHFYYLGGPDFIVGPDAPAGSRNILGVIEKVGVDTAKEVIVIRKRCRDLMSWMGGKVIHPVLGLPGGVAKAFTEEKRQELKVLATDAIAFAQFTLKAFHDIVLGNKAYVDLVLSDAYLMKTFYMGLVNDQKKVDFYEDKVRVVDTTGKEVELFKPQDYYSIFAEHVEPWSYIKFPYLRKRGWKGFTDGEDTSLVRVAPLGRLNASEGMATPLAQQEYEKMYETLGGKPAHNTLAWHWARLIEVLQAAEVIKDLSESEELTDPKTRNMDLQTPKEGVGIVEAPRGTLIHHFKSDSNGVITEVNLMVATLF